MSKNQESLPLATTTIGQEEIAAAQEVLMSGNFTMGARVRKFEEDFARFVGSKYAVMVNSGSSANLLMCCALRFHSQWSIPEGAEVIVPTVSWSTTFYPVNQAGLTLKFVDVSSDDWNISITGVREAITERTKAIFAVNLLGASIDWKSLQLLCDEFGLVLIEDNCESLGSERDGKKAGTFGLMASHSTFFSHHMCTMEGGVITTDDEEAYQILQSLRAHGWTRDLPDINHVYTKTGDKFDDWFRFVLPGYNVRPLEIEAAIGIEQLKKLQDFIDVRRVNAEHLKAILPSDFAFKLQTDYGNSSWFGFGFVIGDDAINKSKVITSLAKVGIETRPIVAGNFLRNPVMKHLKHTGQISAPNADYLHDFGFFIGNHQRDIRKNLDFFIGQLREIV